MAWLWTWQHLFLCAAKVIISWVCLSAALGELNVGFYFQVFQEGGSSSSGSFLVYLRQWLLNLLGPVMSHSHHLNLLPALLNLTYRCMRQQTVHDFSTMANVSLLTRGVSVRCYFPSLWVTSRVSPILNL